MTALGFFGCTAFLAIAVLVRRLSTRADRRLSTRADRRLSTRAEQHETPPPVPDPETPALDHSPKHFRPPGPPARAIGGPSVWLIAGRRARNKAFSVGLLAKAIQTRGAQVVLAEVFAVPDHVDELDPVVEGLGVRVIHHAFGADPAAVILDAIATAKRDGADVILINATWSPQGRRGSPSATLPDLLATTGHEAEVTEVMVVAEGGSSAKDLPPTVEGVPVTGAILINPPGRESGDFVLDDLSLRLLRFPRQEPASWDGETPPGDLVHGGPPAIPGP